MDELLKLVRADATLTAAEIAARLGREESDVAAQIADHEANGVILGRRTIINEEKLGVNNVRAVIEVKITPEREGGFDRLAARIARFDEVHSCYLMSGGYDLLVVVEGADLRMRRIQRTWRRSLLRRVLAARRQVPDIYDFMPGLFAKLAFAANFILPAAREVPYMLGLAWARARRRMAMIGAPEVDSHGYELEDSLRDSVMYVLTSNGFTVRELKEFLPRVEHEYLSIYRGVRSTGNAYRLYLQRVHFLSEEEADRKVAEAVAEVVRLQRAAQH